MAKRLLPTLNRVLIEKITAPAKTNAGILLPEKSSKKKSFTLLQTIAISGVFSAVSGWYGFMFGRESARKELGDLIESLRNPNSDSVSPPPSHS